MHVPDIVEIHAVESQVGIVLIPALRTHSPARGTLIVDLLTHLAKVIAESATWADGPNQGRGNRTPAPAAPTAISLRNPGRLIELLRLDLDIRIEEVLEESMPAERIDKQQVGIGEGLKERSRIER